MNTVMARIFFVFYGPLPAIHTFREIKQQVSEPNAKDDWRGRLL